MANAIAVVEPVRNGAGHRTHNLKAVAIRELAGLLAWLENLEFDVGQHPHTPCLPSKAER